MESRTTGFLKTADGQVETLRIRPAGGDSGTVLVLLHEGLGCIDLWRDFPQLLAVRSGFGVFAYSRIGYGRSDPCALPRPLTYMHHEAERILPEVLASLEAESIILVGHSDGASIAAIHAGSTPDPRLCGLILMAPHFFAEQVSTRYIVNIFTPVGSRFRLSCHPCPSVRNGLFCSVTCCNQWILISFRFPDSTESNLFITRLSTPEYPSI